MSHKSGHIIINSMFHVFDPNDAEYEGVRDHFSTSELAEIDRIRALNPDTHDMTLQEKLFSSYACGKAIMTGD